MDGGRIFILDCHSVDITCSAGISILRISCWSMIVVICRITWLVAYGLATVPSPWVIAEMKMRRCEIYNSPCNSGASVAKENELVDSQKELTGTWSCRPVREEHKELDSMRFKGMHLIMVLHAHGRQALLCKERTWFNEQARDFVWDWWRDGGCVILYNNVSGHLWIHVRY